MVRDNAAELDRATETPFPPALLSIGFSFALVLAAGCLIVAAWYLFTFLETTRSAIEGLLTAAAEQKISENVLQLGVLARTAIARYALLSCGVCVAMAFGFLGFALFLIGVRGEMEAKGEGAGYKASISRLAPGTFVILCSVVLIAICVTRTTGFEMKKAGDSTGASASDDGKLLGDTKK